mmetsp:Transcript_29147/g.41026  ORF Transcript_29147/g.41026 Transcript_29147/m.41026 type:complete len:133 (-) Transcript_29147:103-501(-)
MIMIDHKQPTQIIKIKIPRELHLPGSCGKSKPRNIPIPKSITETKVLKTEIQNDARKNLEGPMYLEFVSNTPFNVTSKLVQSKKENIDNAAAVPKRILTLSSWLLNPFVAKPATKIFTVIKTINCDPLLTTT